MPTWPSVPPFYSTTHNAGFLCYLHLTGKLCLSFAANTLILAMMSPWPTRLAQFHEFPPYNLIQLASEDSTEEYF
jgi:hypothetical protein